MDEPDEKKLIERIISIFALASDYDATVQSDKDPVLAVELADLLIAAYQDEAGEKARKIQAHCDTLFAALVTETVDRKLSGNSIH